MFINKFKFNIKEELSVGLDIGSSSIKAVALEAKDKQVILKKFNITQVTPGVSLSSTIKQGLGVMGISDEKINISLTGQSVITRYVWLPLMSQKELISSLKFEAAKLIPFSIEEVNVDSYILKQDVSNNKMLVLIVAAKKEAILERIKLIQDSGFKVGVVDVDSLALINAFNFNYHSGAEKELPKAFALLNIGASVSNLNILEEGIPVFSRDIYIAGSNFSQKITDTSGIDLSAAEQAKIEPDEAKQQKIAALVESIVSSLVSEIRISFDYYESQGASSVEKIFLSGGGSLFYNLKNNLNHMLGMDIDYWDPSRHLTFLENNEAEKLKSTAAQFAVALGLAMR